MSALHHFKYCQASLGIFPLLGKNPDHFRCSLRTVNGHFFHHEVFVDEGADFAPVDAAELGGGIPYFESPVLTEPVAARNAVPQIDPVLEQLPDRLGRPAGQPLVKRLGIRTKEPFDVNLTPLTGTLTETAKKKDE